MLLKFKLLFLFIPAIVIPLAIAGLFSFQKAKVELVNETVNGLTTIADVQKKRVNEGFVRYLENVKTVTSQPQLAVALRDYEETGNLGSLEEIQSIIEDQKTLISTVDIISIRDQNGLIVASTDLSITGKRDDLSAYAKGVETLEFNDVFKNVDNLLRVRFFGPLFLGSRKIGVVEMVMSPYLLTSVTEDYAGLGKTGEVMLVEKDLDGGALYLAPLRYDQDSALVPAIIDDKTNVAVAHAILGEEKEFIESDFVDYRGEPIFAVTRFISSLGWGLVVKIDQAEALAPANELLRTFIIIIAITTLIAVVLAYLLSRLITKPVIELTNVASKLEGGDFSVQAATESKDEIGSLGLTFNRMVSRLKESYATLEQKVLERTAELNKEAVALAEAQEIGKIGSWELNIETNEAVWSEELYRIFGLDPQMTKLNAGSYLSHVYPDDQKLAKTTIEESLKTDNLFEFDHRVKLPDGQIHWVRAKGKVITDDKGNPVSMTGTAQDITKEKQIDKAKTEFVSLASHQLRTPLSSIGWYSEMLLSGYAGKITDEQKKYLEEVYAGNERMVELVNTLLDASRLELGTFIIEPQPTDIISVAQSVLDEQKPGIEKRKVKIKPLFEKGIPMIQADVKLLRMIFQNLISNAVKYSFEGGSVEVEISKDEKNIKIRVSDTGLGIPEAQKDKIFQKLFRADNARISETEGTGLGLYIVKSIADQSGGRVWFESEENKGTTFYVTLPLAGMKNVSKPT